MYNFVQLVATKILQHFTLHKELIAAHMIEFAIVGHSIFYMHHVIVLRNATKLHSFISSLEVIMRYVDRCDNSVDNDVIIHKTVVQISCSGTTFLLININTLW